MNDRVDKILKREADLFERERAREDEDRRPWGRPRLPAGDRGQVYSLRIPVERLATLRRLAEKRGVQPTALIREWILERLAAEDSRSGRRGSVTGEPRPTYSSRKPRKPSSSAKPKRPRS